MNKQFILYNIYTLYFYIILIGTLIRHESLKLVGLFISSNSFSATLLEIFIITIHNCADV